MQSELIVATLGLYIYNRMCIEIFGGPFVRNFKAGCRYVRARYEEELQWSVSDEDLVPYANGNDVALS